MIRAYFGKGYTPAVLMMPANEFETGLDHLADTILAPHSNWRVYFVNGLWHVFLNNATYSVTTVGGVMLRDWIASLVNGDPSWANVRP